MRSRKKPLLWDFVYGVCGTFIETKAYMPGLVHIIYVPLGSFKAVQYPEPVPENAILKLSLSKTHIPGVFPDLVIIKENSKGESPVGNQIAKIFRETIKDMELQLEDEKLAKYTQTHKAHTAKAESQKQVAQDMMLRKTRDNEGENNNRFGGGLFNRRFNDFNRPDDGEE